MLLCNWNCHACDQFSNMPSIPWVKKATMTMGQIEYFCWEMYRHNAYIGRIRLVGGEPTIHPKIEDIIKALRTLVPNHIGRIEIVTNGSHPEKINPVRDKIDKVRISGEKQKEVAHTANLIHTPKSLGYSGIRCNAPEHCGFSLNYYGYAPCSSGAGIARLYDAMQWQRLSLPVEGVNKTWPELQDMCDLCYHGLKPEHKVKCGTKLYHLNVPSKEIWNELAPWLNGKQPDWKVYGSQN